MRKEKEKEIQQVTMYFSHPLLGISQWHHVAVGGLCLSLFYAKWIIPTCIIVVCHGRMSELRSPLPSCLRAFRARLIPKANM